MAGHRIGHEVPLHGVQRAYSTLFAHHTVELHAMQSEHMLALHMLERVVDSCQISLYAGRA